MPSNGEQMLMLPLAAARTMPLLKRALLTLLPP